MGKYTCKVIKSTAKKLIVKLTGKSKNNGPLESYHPIKSGYHNIELRYKNEGEDEIHRTLQCIKYSYDGDNWHKGTFTIKGKESVYLYFIEYINKSIPGETIHNIKISDYQYAQMFFWTIRYNLLRDVRYPQIRFNLSSGTAAVSDFISYGGHYQEAFMWDDEIFERTYEVIDY